MTATGDPGRLTLHPDAGTVGEWGTWIARYTCGAGGLRAGGAIQVELPHTWNQWLRNSSRAVQATRQSEPFYVTARASRAGVEVRCEVQEQTGGDVRRPGSAPNEDAEYVKRARRSLDGTARRYCWVVRVTVETGELREADTIDVVYGDRSAGGRGYTPPLWAASPERVLAAVDVAGTGDFAPLPEERRPMLQVRPAPPAEVAVVAPSVAVVREACDVLVAALDPNLNPSWPAGLRVSVRVVEGEAQLDGAEKGVATLSRSGGEWSVRVRLTPGAAGVIRLRAQSEDGRLFALSNPCRAVSKQPAERLFWGDLHGHTRFSWDATGPAEDAFRYARDVSGLQVYGNADHGESLSADDWQRIAALNAEFYDPGRFATLVGYENSQRFPFGHHNVFYRAASGQLRHANDAPLDQFISSVAASSEAGAQDVLTIPHHMIALGNPSRPNTDWTLHDPRFHRVAEIYSGHGQSELSIEDSPLASDVVDFTLTGPAAAPSSLRDGWLRGHKFGVIASSDNHIARPGRDGFGVMAVWAPELTREAVFDAIRRRRTVGSTGCRVILDFALNGTAMGGALALSAGEPVHLTGEIVAAGPLRFVEILRADLDAQEWSVAHRQWWAGSAPSTLALEWTDPAPPARGLYYVRLRQRDLIHGRVAMAWSSPVWVSR